MNTRKRIASWLAVFVVIAAAAVAGEAPRQGDQAGERPSPEERAKLAKASAPLAAKAIAQYVELSAEEAKKFCDAYVAESEAAQKRVAEAREAGGGEQMMTVFRENSEKMQKLLEANLKPEQAKKAGAVLGRFNALDRSIQSLLQAKVEAAKVEKALPVLVKYAVAQQELMGKMEPGSGPSEELRAKLTELREKTAKELAPIVGEEAAAAFQRSAGMRGGGGPRGGGQ